MAILKGAEKIVSSDAFKLFFSFTIAFVIAAAITIDQQSKNLVKLLVVAGLFAVLLNWHEIKRHTTECDKRAVWALGLYFLGILLAIAANPINEDTWHDLKTMSIGFTSILIWCLMISIRFRADYFWWGVVLCAISAGIYALIEVGLYGVTHRAVGSSGKWIMFGDVAMMSGVISIAAVSQFRKYQSPVRLIPIAASVLGITASVLSGTRGAWLFFPLAAVIVLFFFYRKGRLQLTWKTTAVISLLFFGVLASAVAFTNATERLEKAYAEVHNYFTQPSDAAGRTSLGQRFEMWRAALDAFKQAPIFGIGPGHFDDHLAELAAENRVNQQVAEAWVTGDEPHPHSHAHNEFLNTLATRGLVGIITEALLFIFMINAFMNSARSEESMQSSVGLAGILLVSGYLIFSLSESVLYHAITANFFFLCLVSLLYLSRKSEGLSR